MAVAALCSVTVSAQNDFGMFKVVASPDGNALFSPKSVQSVLAMTALGAKGETNSEILNGIGYAGLKQRTVNRLNWEFQNDIKSLDPQVQVISANALWKPADLKLRCCFKMKSGRFFDATTGPLDVNAINSWCDEKTNHLIPEIIQQLNGSERLVLTNALYFKGVWSSVFEKDLTSNATFHNLGGNDTKLPMMHKEFNIQYADFGDFAIAQLPYGNGSFCMDIILPAEGKCVKDVLASMDDAKWKECLSKLAAERVKVSLPRFELNAGTNLNKTLQAQGINLAFSPAADFSRLSREALRISDVIQKVYVKVDEDGTEAAAVTAVTMTKSAAPVKSVIFNVNRPFLFVIRQTNADGALFMGKVEEL